MAKKNSQYTASSFYLSWKAIFYINFYADKQVKKSYNEGEGYRS